MAEEKITNDEILSGEQLEEVAGGYAWETEDDIMRLKALKVLPSSVSTDAIRSEGILKSTMRSRYNIEIDTKFAGANGYQYRIDGKYYSRETAWRFICDREGYNYDNVFGRR